MQHLRTIVIAIFIAGIALAFLVAQVPISAEIPNPAEAGLRLALLTFLITLIIGAAVLFLMGLQNFKSSFRQTYYFICAGLVVHAIGSLAYPISLYLGIWNTSFTAIAGSIPFTIGAVLVWVGLRNFAGIIGVKSWAANYLLLSVSSLVGVIVFFILPHKEMPGLSELEFDIAHSIIFLEPFIYLFACGLIMHILAVTGQQYRRPLKWLFAALMTYVVATILYILLEFVPLPAWVTPSFLAPPLAGAFILLIIAGYSFASMTQRVEHPLTNASLIDIIVYSAGLAATPRELDPILDDLRAITAERSSDEPLTEDETAALKKIYSQIEDYLITKEKLRKFDRISLRSDLAKRFNLEPGFFAHNVLDPQKETAVL